MADLTDQDIASEFRDKVFIQDYSAKEVIDGVKTVEIESFLGEEGDFSELLRVDQNGELEKVPGFKLAQINRVNLLPDTIKAWHLHYLQNEIWYPIPSGQILVGLWDIREGSPTKGKTMRIVLGGGNKMLFIPNGVAHGVRNISQECVEMLYLVDHTFDKENPDERRIHWDGLGKEFWDAERD